MKFARAFLIFCYGLFAISAQTLLFREFLTAFEGNDISVGLFFASWFFWVSAGAIIGYCIFKISKRLSKNIDLLFFAYIPAFVLELILIINARQIAGVSSYTLLSIRTMVFLSLIVNAPVSIITGIFFPLACQWVKQDSLFPVPNVYILEAAGSFLGGIGATVLLGLGVSSATIFFLLTFVVSLAVFIASVKSKIKLVFSFLILVCTLLCLFAGTDKSVNRYIQTVKWAKLLPSEALTGSFQTAQAEYLYGTYRGQWVVVSQGSTCLSLPDKATTGRIAAIGLSQKPDAKKILVVGSGLGLCHDFLQLDNIENVGWAHCDSQYIQKIDNFLPAQFKTNDLRLSFITTDIRSQLAKQNNFYDIVIINLPDATSSVLSRYFTVEFYEQLKKSMSADGVVAVRVSGGENIMGTELADLGASTKYTLQKVFLHLVLVPGDDTWFIASDSENITDNPNILQMRYAQIKNADAILAPSALLSVYLPDRAAAAMKCYDISDLPPDLLINKDQRPLASLYSLLLALKQSGTSVTKIIKLIAAAGIGVFLVPVFVFVILRLFYIIRTKNENHISSFDSSFLVFSAGALGIGTIIVLMYLYQTTFGSLYLHIGIISSLFMVGLTIGAVLIRYLPRSNNNLLAVILIHTALLAAIAYLPAEFWTHQNFAIIFFLCGLCSGAYFPLAAGQLAGIGLETTLTGSKLDMADHIGASAGSLATGLVLVPALGTKGTILVFLVLILANIPATLFKIFKKTVFASPVLNFRKVGYVLFGTAACAVICSNLLSMTAWRFKPSLPPHTAQTLAGQLRIKPAVFTAAETEKKIGYFKVYDKNKTLAGFIFSTEELAPQVCGFGGKINLAVYIDTTGKLADFSIIHSNETPYYIDMLIDWYQKLKGCQLFASRPFDGIDTVTGATISSEAVIGAIELSSRKFADDVLGQSASASAARRIFLPDRRGIYLLIAIVLSLVVIYKGNFWSRIIVLVFNLIVGGFIFNAQYSSEQVTALLTGHLPALGLSGTFLLTVGMPLSVLLFGNIYCGYFCPFGAAQELVSFIVPDRFKKAASYETMRKARFVKYVILFIAVAVFFLSRSKQTLVPDVLIAVFNLHSRPVSLKSAIFVIMVFAIVASVFYRRLWCRYLCPVGAFLSLFNNLVVFKRLVPAKRFARCEFGLTSQDNMDCIYCDRCRHQLKDLPQKSAFSAGTAKYLLLVVLTAGSFLSALYIDEFVTAIPSPVESEAVFTTTSDSAGRPRDVDLQKIRKMIEEKRLSDHEASFYEESQ